MAGENDVTAGQDMDSKTATPDKDNQQQPTNASDPNPGAGQPDESKQSEQENVWMQLLEEFKKLMEEINQKVSGMISSMMSSNASADQSQSQSQSATQGQSQSQGATPSPSPSSGGGEEESPMSSMGKMPSTSTSPQSSMQGDNSGYDDAAEQKNQGPASNNEQTQDNTKKQSASMKAS